MSHQATPQFYRMKRSPESQMVHYVMEHKEKQWYRFFAAQLATQELYDTPAYLERNKEDITQLITQEVYAYETALLKSGLFTPSGALTHCLLLPQRLPDVLEQIQPADTLLLYVFTEGCGVCKYTTPIVSALAQNINNYTENEIKVLALYGYSAVLNLTQETWIMESLGVPKFFLFTNGLRQLLHNPDLLHNYNPDETYQHLFDLLKK
ncbi:hypothetical protein C7N43_34540 [Sphingobacteriales bacterium UPWRP_1]|nr:hypothetical protein C7N43_34540 [Sphingobacteriales bacterium UPWRP_1]